MFGIEIHAQGFERDLAVDDGVPGEIDHSHGPPAEGGLDFVASYLGLRHTEHCKLTGPLQPVEARPVAVETTTGECRSGAERSNRRPERPNQAGLRGHDPCVGGTWAFWPLEE